MTRPWRAQSFGAKLLLLLLMAGGTAAFVVCAVLVPIQYFQLKTLAINTAQSQARVVAVHSAAAISFDDPAAGAETLSALRAARAVIAATLFREDDPEPFASYLRAGKPQPTIATGQGPFLEQAGQVVVIESVRHEGKRLGRLVLVYDLDSLQQALAWNVALAALAGAAAIAAAGAAGMRLRRVLSRPVTELARTAQQIAQTGDYSVRARRFSDDELGRFTDIFNQMLMQIQEQAAQIWSTNRELRRRNEEMEQFVHTVSHDLKSPLVTITGFVGLLREDVLAGRQEEAQEATDHLVRAAQRMSHLIDDLLQLSRIGRVANELQTVDVQTLINEVAEDLSPRLKEMGARLVVEPRVPPAMADRMRLVQVFENLITNAIKYGSDTPNLVITVGGRREGDENRYFVRDNGPGISPEYHQRIFGLFQRLDTRREGTGVGLAVVARIAESHGGRAWVESTPGEGATFWIALPVDPRKASEGLELQQKGFARVDATDSLSTY